MSYIKVIQLIMLVIMMVTLSACTPQKVTTFSRSKFLAQTDINPDDYGRASPLVIEVFHLKDHVKFESSNYDELVRDKAAMLGDDLIRRDEIFIRPGETEFYDRTLSKEVKYVGYIAYFRRPQKDGWKMIKSIPNKYNHLTVISITKNHMSEQTLQTNHKKKETRPDLSDNKIQKKSWDKSNLFKMLTGIGVVSLIFIL